MSRSHAVVMRSAAVAAAAAGAVVGAATAGAGCAQLAGIGDTNGNNRAGDSLTVTRMSIGATVTTSPLDLTGLEATYFVASSAATGFDRVMADSTQAPGLWTTKLRAPAPVEFTLPDLPTPVPRLFTFPSAQLQVLYGVLEHPNRTPAPDGATFAVTVALDAAPAMADVFQSYIIGPWLVRNFATTEFTVAGTTLTTAPYGFVPGNSVAGRPQLDAVTMQDAFLILRYNGAALTGVAEAPPFDQTTAATTLTTGAMTAVTPDQMLAVPLSPATAQSRYSKAQPAVGPTLQMGWSLVAAPGYRIASNSGPVLQSGNPLTTDTSITAAYGNPFAARGWNTILTLATNESRPYQLPGATTTIDLFAGMNQFLEPTAAANLNLPAGLPIVISLGGVPLVSDGQMIAPPTKFVDVSFVVNPAPGVTGPPATVYDVQLYELTVDTTMAPVRKFAYDALSDQAAFSLPPELFQPGHTYTLRGVATLGGYPSVDAGNFVNRQLPLSQSYLDSGVFTVMAVTP